jgi:hypothetical protein
LPEWYVLPLDNLLTLFQNIAPGLAKTPPPSAASICRTARISRAPVHTVKEKSYAHVSHS